MRLPLPLCVLALATATVAQAPAHRADDSLRVLLVAHDPANPDTGMADVNKPRTLPLLRERTAAWESLLRYHFDHVTVVHGADYKVSMSDNADVTIFDTRPKALTPTVNKVDKETGERIYKAATYLPETFGKPAITISDNSPRIGEPMGLKLDWL